MQWHGARGFFPRKNGRRFLNEVNTIPGFTSISMYPKLWEASGVLIPIDRPPDRLGACRASRKAAHQIFHRAAGGRRGRTRTLKMPVSTPVCSVAARQERRRQERRRKECRTVRFQTLVRPVRTRIQSQESAQALPLMPSIPSFPIIGTIMRAPTGSAHHHRKPTFSSRPASRMTDR